MNEEVDEGNLEVERSDVSILTQNSMEYLKDLDDDWANKANPGEGGLNSDVSFVTVETNI